MFISQSPSWSSSLQEKFIKIVAIYDSLEKLSTVLQELNMGTQIREQF